MAILGRRDGMASAWSSVKAPISRSKPTVSFAAIFSSVAMRHRWPGLVCSSSFATAFLSCAACDAWWNFGKSRVVGIGLVPYDKHKIGSYLSRQDSPPISLLDP